MILRMPVRLIRAVFAGGDFGREGFGFGRGCAAGCGRHGRLYIFFYDAPARAGAFDIR